MLSSWVIPWDKQSLRAPRGLQVLVPCDNVGVAVPRGEEQGWVSSCWVAPLELLRPLHLHPGFCCCHLKTILAPTELFTLHLLNNSEIWTISVSHKRNLRLREVNWYPPIIQLESGSSTVQTKAKLSAYKGHSLCCNAFLSPSSLPSVLSLLFSYEPVDGALKWASVLHLLNRSSTDALPGLH